MTKSTWQSVIFLRELIYHHNFRPLSPKSLTSIFLWHSQISLTTHSAQFLLQIALNLSPFLSQWWKKNDLSFTRPSLEPCSKTKIPVSITLLPLDKLYNLHVSHFPQIQMKLIKKKRKSELIHHISVTKYLSCALARYLHPPFSHVGIFVGPHYGWVCQFSEMSSKIFEWVCHRIKI